MNENRSSRVAELEKRIADLKARLPKHSTPASMLIELEDLEEELAATLAAAQADEAQETEKCG
jgi:hypothetical protein